VTKAFAAVLTLTVLMLAGERVARAGDPNAEKARAHFQQGDTFFKLDKYAAALQEFEQAYLAKQDASFLYNIAQCHRLMGNRVEAIRFYKRYLTDAPTAANRPVAEKHIRDLESALGAEELTGSHPATPPPTPGPPSTPPPRTPPTPTPAPAPAPAPTLPPVVALDAPPPPPSHSDALLTNPSSPSQTDDHPFYTRWWFWTAVGGVAVTGLILVLLSNRDPSCPAGRQCQ
jgi:tetratricopeptide (TPR) repeat protein